MWASDTMTLGESLVVSLLGISVVMTALIVLALIIVVFSKNLALVGVGGEKQIASAAHSSSTVNDIIEEEYAVLMAAVCEEVKLSPDEFKIIEIKSID